MASAFVGSEFALLFILGQMEDPQARKARLKALKEDAAQNGVVAQPESDEVVLKFRNYAVRDEKIVHEQAPVTKPPELEKIQEKVLKEDEPEVMIIFRTC